MQAIAQQNAAETTIRTPGVVPVACLPEFGRWQDVQRLFGIKRGTLYRLIGEGKIRSINLRQPGRRFGCRLIHLQSVRDYLHSVMAEQANLEASR